MFENKENKEYINACLNITKDELSGIISLMQDNFYNSIIVDKFIEMFEKIKEES